MKELIKKIGDLVIENFFDFDKNEYEYEGECSEPWNGIYEPASASMSIVVNYNCYDIDCSIKEFSGKRKYVEAVFSDKNRPNIEMALEKYLKENIAEGEFFTEVEDDYRDRTMDEWQRNGFRNEADYWHYRLGA